MLVERTKNVSTWVFVQRALTPNVMEEISARRHIPWDSILQIILMFLV
jgi:hypothetical protein